MQGAHYSSSDKPKGLGVLPSKRGALYNGEGTLKTFEEMPYALERGQMSFETEKSKQSVNRDELKRRNNASAKKSRDVRRTRELQTQIKLAFLESENR